MAVQVKEADKAFGLAEAVLREFAEGERLDGQSEEETKVALAKTMSETAPFDPVEFVSRTEIAIDCGTGSIAEVYALTLVELQRSGLHLRLTARRIDRVIRSALGHHPDKD